MAKVRDYRVWAPEEEDALRLGVAKHGIGAWEIIRQDPAYRNLLWCVAPGGSEHHLISCNIIAVLQAP